MTIYLNLNLIIFFISIYLDNDNLFHCINSHRLNFIFHIFLAILNLLITLFIIQTSF
jgi:hypothetical protein